jgi:hypothetical protein
MTVLLWGPASDAPLAAVREALRRQGARVVFLDQARTHEAEIELVVDRDVRGSMRLGDLTLDLKTVRAVYPRLDDVARLIGGAAGGAELARARAFESALGAWIEITPALVVSRPSAMASNGSKPYQSALIAAHGFDTPRTLITTDRAAVLAFRERHGAVIYKSISGVRSIVARLGDAELGRLDDIAACPVQFQEHVTGTDVRVHVVGEAVFACEIVSTADDYRYARAWETPPAIRPIDLPTDLADRCRALAAHLGLEAAGIDLRRRLDGRWCCFEVNPSPGFTYYEQDTGQPIADAFARHLAAGRSAARNAENFDTRA